MLQEYKLKLSFLELWQMCLVFALIHNSQVRPSEPSDKFDHSAHRTHLFVSLKFHVSENCISSHVFVWKKRSQGARADYKKTTPKVKKSRHLNFERYKVRF